MTDNQMMALLGANTSLQTRFAYAVIGVLALFFPGYVAVAFLKSTSNALQRLSFEERCALANVLRLD
jgi:uncharacterized membrane protein YuzA (DUF378 family)